MTNISILPWAQFADTHFVDEQYHKHHSQLVHQHKDVLELFYVMKGYGRYIVGKREYAMQPGNLVICNAHIMHGEAPFQDHAMQSYCCVLRELQLPLLPPNTLTAPADNPVLLLTNNKQAVEYILLAIHTLNIQSPQNTHLCEMLGNTLLAIVYEEFLSRKATTNVHEQKTEELIRNITEYLDEHFMEDVSLQDLGDRFHMSHYYLARIFKKETGVSPIKYVTYRKIGEVQNLLMNSAIPIGKIGEMSGFGGHCHLDAVFKKYIGVTPSQYRKHFQKLNY